MQQLFRSRYWWQIQDNEKMSQINFMWTVFRNVNVFNALPPKLAGPQLAVSAALTRSQGTKQQSATRLSSHFKSTQEGTSDSRLKQRRPAP